MGDVAASAEAGLLPRIGGEDERDSDAALERECTDVRVTKSAVPVGFATPGSSVGGGTFLDPLSL